ncbi:MAG: hypothetical protein V7742_14250 [Halioglobus sp.]
MPRLVVGYTELGGGKWKKGKGFLQPNFELLPKPRQVRQDRRVVGLFLGIAFMEFSKKLSGKADEFLLLEMGSTGGRNQR